MTTELYFCFIGQIFGFKHVRLNSSLSKPACFKTICLRPFLFEPKSLHYENLLAGFEYWSQKMHFFQCMHLFIFSTSACHAMFFNNIKGT